MSRKEQVWHCSTVARDFTEKRAFSEQRKEIKGASSCSGERHSHSRHREERVQAGSGPGMFRKP